MSDEGHPVTFDIPEPPRPPRASDGTSRGNQGLRTAAWLIGALSAAVIVTALANSAAESVTSTTEVTATSLAAAAPNTTLDHSAATTTTTIPDVEALIPLTVEEMEGDVAQSVAFVLSQQGTGSGVVISEDLLVTNAHVVWPNRTVSLVFRNGATHEGRIIALDPFVDLALVDISRLSRKPAPIEIGSLDTVGVGDELFVVGYPMPSEFTPEPTIDAGEVLGFTDWPFTGVEWVTIGAPAIGGQSGGAVVDEFGRLVGISTFGSTDSLTSISVDDMRDEVVRLLGSDEVRGLEPRALPRGGGRRSNEVDLEGEWDQELLLGWFSGASDVSVEWEGGSGELSASTIGGARLAAEEDMIEFDPTFAFPVVVAAEAEVPTQGTLESSLPLIAYEDPDHGKVLDRRGTLSGIFEVGRDRDFFYVDLDRGEEIVIKVESAARTRLFVYAPDGTVGAKDIDMAGFIGGNAELRFEAEQSGRHVVSVESSLSTVSGYTIITQQG